MKDFGDTEHQKVILAALLHDIGNLPQRDGGEYHARHTAFPSHFVEAFNSIFGEEYSAASIAELIHLSRTNPATRNQLILHISDELAAAEDHTEHQKLWKSNEANLIAVTSRVSLGHRSPSKQDCHRIEALRMDQSALFPGEYQRGEEQTYTTIWKKFVEKAQKVGKYHPNAFRTLFFILKEFGSFVPSATPWEENKYNRAVPDTSLFDHSKATCAIAAALNQTTGADFSDHHMQALADVFRELRAERAREDQQQIIESDTMRAPLFILLRADMGGIQKFIYTITQPGAETKGTSKRLRGRSFYVSLLNDVLADWIVRQFHLPIANILFCGGGRFDILLPYTNDTIIRLDDLDKQIDDWLFRQFNGELSIQIAPISVAARDFYSLGVVYGSLDDSLAEKKRKKFAQMLCGAEFFAPQATTQWCPICQMEASGDDGEGNWCRTHREIGATLPKKSFISFVYGDSAHADGVAVDFANFGVTVLLQDDNEVARLLVSDSPQEACIYGINPLFLPTTGLDYLPPRPCPKPVSFGFKFFGNSAPVARRECRILSPPHEMTKKGNVLEFEEIAELSTGAKYLGILKMDVDHLGLLMRIGIDQPTFARVATLSSSFETFFNGWLNEVCDRVSTKWRKSLPPSDEKREAVTNLFYVVYSGGDDLFVIGPWDQVVELSLEIYKDFKTYTCDNEDISLSGGITFVKPRFPVQRFATLVDEQLEQSKNKGRDRVTVFGQTIGWRKNGVSFEGLIDFAQNLCEAVEDKAQPLPKGFVYFLRRLEQEFRIGTDQENLNWIPQFIYSHTRRVKKEVEQKLSLRTEVMAKRGKMTIPVSYVSLKTRKG